jgi:hypothetical protein
VNRRWFHSRRALLGGLGALGLGAFMPRRQAAAQANTAKRFLVVHVPEGMWTQAARPQPGAASLGPIFSPLDPFKSKLTVLSGLELASRDHGPGGDGHHRGVPHMLTCTEMADDGNAGGPSVDQKIAAAIGADTTYESLQFAVRIVYGDTNAALIWAGAHERLPAMQNPWEAYERIFGGMMTDPAKPQIDLRKSALDHALAEIGTLRTRLPAADQLRLDSYHASLRDIERRLGNIPQPGSCVQPELGQEVDDPRAEALYPDMGKLQMDLIVAALRCDVTRVASLQWGNSNDQCSYPWLGVNMLGHDMAHSEEAADKKQVVYNWYSQQFAYLLSQLDAIDEGAGTMLDNTVVLWVSEFGNSNAHAADNLLWLVMGNAGGYLRQGQVLKVDGRSVSDLHATICKAFGIADSTYGNPAYCDGPIDALIA